MKRLFYALLSLVLLTACAAEPLEPPQEVPAPEPERTEPVFSPVNPDPADHIIVRLDKRYAQVDVKSLEMPAPPFLEHDTFYFPLQFVAEAFGVQYAFANGCAYLQCDGHITQFFIDSTRFVVDSVEGHAEGNHALFREGLPQAPVDERFTPLLRDGVVFLPVDFLPTQFRSAYNSFGAQMCPEDCENNGVHFFNDRFPPTETDTALSVSLFPNDTEALVNGVPTQLPAAPFIENDVFFFPVETMAELMGVGFERIGNSFRLFNSDYEVRLFLNSRLYVMNGQAAQRVRNHRVFTPWPNYVPVDDSYVPVERDGVIFLPSDYFQDQQAFYHREFFHLHEDLYPESGVVVFSDPSADEQGIGGFYLNHKFDNTPPELRANLRCVGKIGEYEGYDILVYFHGGLTVHVLRLQPGQANTLCIDGVITAVAATNPAFSTPRGLRCGDSPERARQLYGNDFTLTPHGQYLKNGPITAIAFLSQYDDTIRMERIIG